MVAWRRRSGLGSAVAVVLPQVLNRARHSPHKGAAGVGEAEGQASRAGRPLDLAGPCSLRSTALGPRSGRRPPATVGEATSSAEAYSIPGPAYFRDTRAPAGHTGGSTETPW